MIYIAYPGKIVCQDGSRFEIRQTPILKFEIFMVTPNGLSFFVSEEGSWPLANKKLGYIVEKISQAGNVIIRG